MTYQVSAKKNKSNKVTETVTSISMLNKWLIAYRANGYKITSITNIRSKVSA